MGEDLKLLDTELKENHEPIIEKFELTRRDRIYVILIVITSVALSILGICEGFNFGYTVTLNLLLASVSLYFAKGAKKLTFFGITSIVLSFSMSLVFSVTTNMSIRIFSVIVIFLLILSFLTLLLRGGFAEGDLGILTTIFTPLLKQAPEKIPKTIRSVFSGDTTRKNNFGKILIGILASLPVLMVVLPLLMSSDAAYSGLVSIFSDNVFSIIMKCLLGIIIALLVVNYCFTLKKEEQKKFEIKTINGIDNVIIISFLSVLSVCYLAYLFSQLAYFFSAFSGFLPNNYEFTVAEYARRGFFELCAIAGINFAIIFIAILLSKKEENKICLSLKLICTFISVFTLLITATAIAKMFLYIGSFGMTELRISTSAFMIFLFIVFVALILRIYFVKIKVIKTAFLTAGIILSLLGILNINTIIADYNYNAYQKGWLNDVDTYEIVQLGDEGVPYLVKLCEDKNKNVAEQAENKILMLIKNEVYYELDSHLVLNSPIYSIGEKKCTNIAQMTFAKHRAYEAIDEYLEKHPNAVYKAGKSYY